MFTSKVFGGRYTSGDKLGEGAQASVWKFHHKAADDSGTMTTYACKQTSIQYLLDCGQ